jgi:FtsH-binding integral membrane protein
MNNTQFPVTFNLQASERQEELQRSFILRVYGWMVLGLAITAAAAFLTLAVPEVLMAIVTNQWLFFGLIIGELVLVVVISAAVGRLSPALAGALFALYAAINGLTLSILLLVYTEASVAVSFGVAAATFGIMTLFGYTTQRDLTKMGSLLFMALIGIVLASLVNLFLNNSAVYWIITYVGVLVFVGLIAYDTQKLKRMALSLGEDGQLAQKASIVGALQLYLDFINLFLMLLRILGRRRS